jgi:lipopolysaccharide transport system permease protein
MDTSKVVITPSRGFWKLNLRELWQYRELLLFLTWRNVSVRYKQTLIGFGWAILQPLVAMVVMGVIFGNFLNVSSEDQPYGVFVLAALVPWNYFANAVNQGSTSLVANTPLVTKVYFPRLIIPIVSALAPLVDFAIAFVLLLIIATVSGIALTAKLLLMPLFLLLGMGAALGIILWTAGLNVLYRDVGKAVPFAVQILMYLSPVVYSINTIPENWRMLFRLNPMTTVIDGFRWVVLNSSAPDSTAVLISVAMVALLLVSGTFFFNAIESQFADVI